MIRMIESWSEGNAAMEEGVNHTHVLSLQEDGKRPADPARLWRGAGQTQTACECPHCRFKHELWNLLEYVNDCDRSQVFEA
jgi:hypothetical protein